MIDNAFGELDNWVSDKGTGGYISYEYNPYVCIKENFLNEELGIQQVREEIFKLSHVLDLHELTNGTCLEIGLGFFGSTHFLFRHLFDEVITIEKNFERVREFVLIIVVGSESPSRVREVVPICNRSLITITVSSISDS